MIGDFLLRELFELGEWEDLGGRRRAVARGPA